MTLQGPKLAAQGAFALGRQRAALALPNVPSPVFTPKMPGVVSVSVRTVR